MGNFIIENYERKQIKQKERWAQHAASMVEVRAACKILVGNLKGKTICREIYQ
jgi:hypothetical protein